MNTFAVKSASPIPPWSTRNVTVLGDALHNMTPYLGMGANAALYDAQMLRNGPSVGLARRQCAHSRAIGIRAQDD
jgi:hypothetical protein